MNELPITVDMGDFGEFEAVVEFEIDPCDGDIEIKKLTIKEPGGMALFDLTGMTLWNEITLDFIEDAVQDVIQKGEVVVG